ncbi:MAG: sulfatase-like hydrolase/transferase [Myxococcales bacterium]|jgi:arylsulfatase A-like enzyme
MGRARRILAGTFGLAAPRSLAGGVLRFCLRAATLWWLLSAGRLLARGQAQLATGWRGLLASLGLTLIAGAAAGFLAFGVAAASGWREGAGGRTPDWTSRARAWLFGGEPAQQQARVGAVLGLCLLAPVLAVLSLRLTQAVVVAIVTPRFAALTVLAVHVGLLVVGLLLWPACRNLGHGLGRLLGRAPGIARVVVNAGRLLSLLALLGAGAVGLSLWLFWKTLSYLPWPVIGLTLGALALAAALGWVVRRVAAVAALEAALFWALALAGVLAVTTMDGRDEIGRRLMLQTPGGALGHRLALAALDFDDDGHLHVMGGRDCAPFDPAISPVAVDVPNNGIDEDCDGLDLDPSSLKADTRARYQVPDEIPRRPPIVLITIDAFAANRLAALGGQRRVTPKIDRLAEEGTLFTACFAQGPSTRLSFPSIFTSRWDSQIRRQVRGKHPYPIASSERMLAEEMRSAGYSTVAVVPAPYFTRSRWPSITDGFDRVVDTPVAMAKERKHNSKQVTDVAIAELKRKRGRKHPLFLWVHYYDAHTPHVLPDEGRGFGSSGEDRYDAELALVDRQVGRLVHAVDRVLGEGAIVIITADHGIAFDEPRHGKHGYGYDLYSVVLHVPLIVRGPGIREQHLDGVVSTMDVAPTITNLARIRRRTPFEGASLLPELTEGRSARPPRLLHEFYIPERLWDDADPLEIASLRTERHHLIHDRRNDTYELYDYRVDPLERSDLVTSAEHQLRLAGLRQQLSLFLQRVNRPGGGARLARQGKDER